ncbi:hypothetical protein UlMin_040614 [Ulmus minor]
MDNILGLLRVRVRRGINLAVRDTLSRTSDPYVVLTMDDQKLKTRMVKKNCNPEWNDELTLSMTNLESSIKLTVSDDDTFSEDDPMGDAEIAIKPYIECLKMGSESLPDGSVVKKVKPEPTNCLSEESTCVWKNGKLVQDMLLKLRNVECGEIEVQIEWIDLPDSKGLLGVVEGIKEEKLEKTMDRVHGLLRIRVKKGINLAVRDTISNTSDPYVVINMGNQKLKTKVIKNNCNPEWNDELTLSVSNLQTPITLTVYDKDTLTEDDKMGDAEIDIKPYIECLRMGLGSLPDGCVVKRVQPDRTNCLSDESSCVWNNGKIVQDMLLRLRNVECGEVLVQVEWIDLPGSRGLLDGEARS